MRLGSVEQIRKVEELSEVKYGLSGEILMEAAGALAARELDQAFFPELNRGTLTIVCGPGNNGADGLVLARHIYSAGHRDICIYLVGLKENRSELFKIQLRRAELHGLKIINLEESKEKMPQIKSSSLVVDALLGIGLSRKIQGTFLEVIEIMNSLKTPVVSLDSPSGLDCNRGVAEGAVIKASMTFTFGLAKPGFFVADGPHYVGKLRILPIGFAFESLRSEATTYFLFNEKLARRYLPKRGQRTNKSDHGHVLVLAGQEGMWGAGVLCASSAYRVGAGYVTWASKQSPRVKLEEAPEVLTTTLAEIDFDDLSAYSAIAIGPGFGVGGETVDVINKLKSYDGPVVVDADAIRCCFENNLFPLPGHWVLTPHNGELSDIISKTPQEIEANRFEAALLGAKVAGCHLLLKGFRSIIAYKHRVMVINSGNSALAKAGTGDVLTGMIAGLLAQGVEPIQATATASYIHGRMADEWVRSGHDRRSLTASDLRQHLPSLISRLDSGAIF